MFVCIVFITAKESSAKKGKGQQEQVTGEDELRLVKEHHVTKSKA